MEKFSVPRHCDCIESLPRRHSPTAVYYVCVPKVSWVVGKCVTKGELNLSIVKRYLTQRVNTVVIKCFVIKCFTRGSFVSVLRPVNLCRLSPLQESEKSENGKYTTFHVEEWEVVKHKCSYDPWSTTSIYGYCGNMCRLGYGLREG